MQVTRSPSHSADVNFHGSFLQFNQLKTIYFLSVTSILKWAYRYKFLFEIQNCDANVGYFYNKKIFFYVKVVQNTSLPSDISPYLTVYLNLMSWTQKFKTDRDFL